VPGLDPGGQPELVKEGALEARQAEAFADLYLRARALELEVE